MGLGACGYPTVGLNNLKPNGWVLADPTAIEDGGAQYTYGTYLSGPPFLRIPMAGAGLPLADALTTKPAWAADSYYAAPDVRWVNGYLLMYFTATPNKATVGTATDPARNTRNCIGVAVAADIHHFNPDPSPLLCGEVWDPDLELVGDQPVLMYSQVDGAGVHTIKSIRLNPDGHGTRGQATIATLLSGGNVTVENATAIFEPTTNQWMMLYSYGDWRTADYTTQVAACPAALNAPCQPTSGGSLPLNKATVGAEAMTGIGGLDFFAKADGSTNAVFHYWKAGQTFYTPFALRKTGQADVSLTLPAS